MGVFVYFDTSGPGYVPALLFINPLGSGPLLAVYGQLLAQFPVKLAWSVGTT